MFRFSLFGLALVLSLIGLTLGHAEPAKPSGRLITLGDFGAEDLAYLAVPNTPPTVGIVLVPDAFGLDNFTKLEADRLAAMGYLVLAVDIYNGHLTTDAIELSTIVPNLSSTAIMKTIGAGIKFFHESPKFHTDHVVAVGWGAGATYVTQAAIDNKGLDGAITFYGPVEDQPERVGKYSAALCAIYPEHDDIATHQKIEAYQQLMKAAGNEFEAWYIAAPRGWSNPSSKAYNPIEDKEAWKVALPFLIRIGAQPVKPKGGSIIDKAKDKIESIFK